MDIATIAGIISAFGLVFIAVAMGGGIGTFINIPSLMIVIGGTLGATMINWRYEGSPKGNICKDYFCQRPYGKIYGLCTEIQKGRDPFPGG